MGDTSLRQYEGLFIFPGRLEDDDVEKVVEKIGGEISSHGGNIEKVDSLGKRRFARPLARQESGHYRRVYFDLAPDRVEELSSRFKFVDGILRVQIVHRTEEVEDNTADTGEKSEQEEGER